MSLFNKYPADQLPRVIGLSGMLTSTSVKAQNVISDLQTLEATFRSTIATVKGSAAFKNVLSHSTKPVESFELFEKFPQSSTIEFITVRVEKIIERMASWPVDKTHERTIKVDIDLNKTAS